MTKTLKMSLVAAVAVAGLTSTASASAISYKGYVQYTSEDLSGDGKTDIQKEAQHDIDYSVSITGKVNDNITANVRVVEAQDDDVDAGTDSDAIGINVDQANFTYSKDGLKSTFGLMLAPLTDGARADGVTVSKNLGGLSVGGGYLYTTSAGAENDVTFVTIGGKASAVSYSLAYASVADAIDNVDAAGNAITSASTTTSVNSMAEGKFLALAVSANVSAVKIALNYASASSLGLTRTDTTVGGVTTYSYADTEDQKQTKLTVSGKAGSLGYKVAYAKNGTDGGSTQIDGSDTAASNISMAATDLSALGDANAIYAELTGKVGMGSWKVAYATASVDGDDNDRNSIKLNYGYKMSSNFAVSANYEINSIEVASGADSKDFNELTLAAKYTF